MSIATIAEQETQKKQYIAKDVEKNLCKLNKWSWHNHKKQSNKLWIWGSHLSESNAEKEKKPIKIEDVAEETRELIGKGVKKTWSVMKSFGKGLADTVDKKEERKDVTTCQHCASSVPPDSSARAQGASRRASATKITLSIYRNWSVN